MGPPIAAVLPDRTCAGAVPTESRRTAVVGEEFSIELERTPTARQRVREPLPMGLELRDREVDASRQTRLASEQ